MNVNNIWARGAISAAGNIKHGNVVINHIPDLIRQQQYQQQRQRRRRVHAAVIKIPCSLGHLFDNRTLRGKESLAIHSGGAAAAAQRGEAAKRAPLFGGESYILLQMNGMTVGSH